MLYDQISLDGVITSMTIIVKPNSVGVSFTNPDYLAMASSMFRFYRGSIKYLFHFCMPCFYAVRVRLRVQHAATVVDPANVHTMVLDVKGDLWVPIVVPIVNFRGWNDFNISDLDTLLVLEQLGPIVGAPSPSTSVVYVNVFRAGGEDMQFAVPRDPSTASFVRNVISREGQDMSLARPQCSIKRMFEKTFEPIAQGQFFREECHSVMSETCENVVDLLKRPADYPMTSLNFFGLTANLTAHKIITASFMWQRGSRVLRHLHRTNVSTAQDGFFLDVGGTSGRTEYGYVPAYNSPTALYQTEAVNLPWYCANPYTVTVMSALYVLGSSQRVLPVNVSLNLSAPETLTQAAGDDWALMFLVPWAQTLFAASTEPKRISLKVTVPQTSKKL
jgi:hypothetical protein